MRSRLLATQEGNRELEASLVTLERENATLEARASKAEERVIDIQLKLETSKSQGLAKITRSIRKSTHPKMVFSMLLKYNMP